MLSILAATSRGHASTDSTHAAAPPHKDSCALALHATTASPDSARSAAPPHKDSCASQVSGASSTSSKASPTHGADQLGATCGAARRQQTNGAHSVSGVAVVPSSSSPPLPRPAILAGDGGYPFSNTKGGAVVRDEAQPQQAAPQGGDQRGGMPFPAVGLMAAFAAPTWLPAVSAAGIYVLAALGAYYFVKNVMFAIRDMFLDAMRYALGSLRERLYRAPKRWIESVVRFDTWAEVMVWNWLDPWLVSASETFPSAFKYTPGNSTERIVYENATCFENGTCRRERNKTEGWKESTSSTFSNSFAHSMGVNPVHHPYLAALIHLAALVAAIWFAIWLVKHVFYRPMRYITIKVSRSADAWFWPNDKTAMETGGGNEAPPGVVNFFQMLYFLFIAIVGGALSASIGNAGYAGYERTKAILWAKISTTRTASVDTTGWAHELIRGAASLTLQMVQDMLEEQLKRITLSRRRLYDTEVAVAYPAMQKKVQDIKGDSVFVRLVRGNSTQDVHVRKEIEYVMNVKQFRAEQCPLTFTIAAFDKEKKQRSMTALDVDRAEMALFSVIDADGVSIFESSHVWEQQRAAVSGTKGGMMTQHGEVFEGGWRHDCWCRVMSMIFRAAVIYVLKVVQVPDITVFALKFEEHKYAQTHGLAALRPYFEGKINPVDGTTISVTEPQSVGDLIHLLLDVHLTPLIKLRDIIVFSERQVRALPKKSWEDMKVDCDLIAIFTPPPPGVVTGHWHEVTYRGALSDAKEELFMVDSQTVRTRKELELVEHNFLDVTFVPEREHAELAKRVRAEGERLFPCEGGQIPLKAQTKVLAAAVTTTTAVTAAAAEKPTFLQTAQKGHQADLQKKKQLTSKEIREAGVASAVQQLEERYDESLRSGLLTRETIGKLAGSNWCWDSNGGAGYVDPERAVASLDVRVRNAQLARAEGTAATARKKEREVAAAADAAEKRTVAAPAAAPAAVKKESAAPVAVQAAAAASTRGGLGEAMRLAGQPVATAAAAVPVHVVAVQAQQQGRILPPTPTPPQGQPTPPQTAAVAKAPIQAHAPKPTPKPAPKQSQGAGVPSVVVAVAGAVTRPLPMSQQQPQQRQGTPAQPAVAVAAAKVATQAQQQQQQPKTWLARPMADRNPCRSSADWQEYSLQVLDEKQKCDHCLTPLASHKCPSKYAKTSVCVGCCAVRHGACGAEAGAQSYTCPSCLQKGRDAKETERVRLLRVKQQADEAKAQQKKEKGRLAKEKRAQVQKDKKQQQQQQKTAGAAAASAAAAASSPAADTPAPKAATPSEEHLKELREALLAGMTEQDRKAIEIAEQIERVRPPRTEPERVDQTRWTAEEMSQIFQLAPGDGQGPPRVTALAGLALANVELRMQEMGCKDANEVFTPETRTRHLNALRKFKDGMTKKELLMPLAMALLSYTSRMAEQKRWLAQTKLRERANLIGAFQKLPLYANTKYDVNLTECIYFKAAMNKCKQEAQATQPTHQTAATALDVARAVELCENPQVRAALVFAWLFAGRLADISYLLTSNVSFNFETGELKVLFVKTKTTQMGGADPNTLVTCVPKPWRKIVREQIASALRRVNVDSNFFPRAEKKLAARVTDMLRIVNPTLGARTLRRGALQLLARNGCKLSEVQRFAGHKDEKTTRRYLNWSWDAVGEQKLSFEAAVVLGSGAEELEEMKEEMLEKQQQRQQRQETTPPVQVGVHPAASVASA